MVAGLAALALSLPGQAAASPRTVHLASVPPPTCQGVWLSTLAGQAQSVQLLCSDSGGQPLSYAIVVAPVHGTLGAVGSNGQVAYTPDAGFSGSDWFTYAASSVNGTASASTVSIRVGSPAGGRVYVAVGDSITVGYGATPGHSYFDLYCAYLQSVAGGSRVDSCFDDALGGLSSQAALGATMQTVLADIKASATTPVVTVDLGGIDLISAPGCQPITGVGCSFIHNMRTILNELETALAAHPGGHVIQWEEAANPYHDNPFGNPALDRAAAALLLGNDFALTPCSSGNLSLIGLNDAINCIAKEKGATPVDAYTPFQQNCTSYDCFFDSIHPNDKGYGLMFDAFRDTPTNPVPSSPPPDGSWPLPTRLAALGETRTAFMPTRAHRKGGTVFTFGLAQQAEVTITIERAPRGRPTIPLATLTADAHPGINTIAFDGRVHGRPLKPGHYLAVFQATGPVIVSTLQTLQFTVVT